MRIRGVVVVAVAVVALVAGLACGSDPVSPDAGAPSDGGLAPDAGLAPDTGLDRTTLPYGQEVVRFDPGPGAGFGQDRFPDTVLGPPTGLGVSAGSLDVLSLGVGGTIVLAFGPRSITDGPGADFVVFENAFYAGGDPTQPFAELGAVAVSTDAVSWREFACDPVRDGRTAWPGCAGWTPTRVFDPAAPLDPATSGGDAFDLATVGLRWARYVRVRDLSTEGAPPSAGFDLDAIGLVHTTTSPR